MEMLQSTGQPGKRFAVLRLKYWSVISCALGLTLACASCSEEEARSNTSHAIDVPSEGVRFAQALNEGNAIEVAELLWFPGPDYPEVPPVKVENVPAACVEDELALFAGREIDVDRIRAEHHVLSGESEDLPDSIIVGEWDIIWLPTADGTEYGRQFGQVNGRVVFSPQQSQGCDDAAREEFGEDS